jgi:prepilin peptidase CpaA
VSQVLNPVQIVASVSAAVAITAAVTDVKQRKIPNALTYPAMIAGIVLQTALSGWRGLLTSVEGGLIFGGIFLLFYAVHAMGAGDVKLAAALGFLVGIPGSIRLMFATGIAGGILALAVAMFSGRLYLLMRNTVSVVFFHARHGMKEHPSLNLGNEKAARMPYGLAFAAGSLYCCLVPVLWR